MHTACYECDNRGRVHDPSAPSWAFWRRVTCPTCNGTMHKPATPRPSYESFYGAEQYRAYIASLKGCSPCPPLPGESSAAYYKRTGIKPLTPLEPVT